MNHVSFRVTAAIAVSCVSLLPSISFGGIIANHGFAGAKISPEFTVDQNGDHHQVFNAATMEFGNFDTSATRSYSAAVGGEVFSSEATGYVSRYANDLLHASAAASTSYFYQSGGTAFPTTQAIGSAYWRDITFVNGTAPAQVRMSFSVSGSLQVPSQPYDPSSTHQHVAYSVARIGRHSEIVSDDFLVGLANITGTGYIGDTEIGIFEISTVFQQNSSVLVSPSWGTLVEDALVHGKYNYSGTAYMDVGYNHVFGGYAWTAGINAAVAVGGTGAVSDFSSTLKLLDVTNIDGTAIAGGFTFDSGLQFAPAEVPEPSSLGLLLVGLTGVGFRGLRGGRAKETTEVADCRV